MDKNEQVHEFLARPEVKELVKALTLAVNGPHSLGHWQETPEKLAQLRQIMWERTSMQEQGLAETSAKAVLVELWKRELLTV